VPKLYTLTKSERLKSRKQIEQLFKEGKKISIFPLHVCYQFTPLTTNDSGLLTRNGVGVSSKNFKRAVDRNRIKRLIRESYRLQKPGFSAVVKANNQRLNMFFIYTGKELPAYKLVFDKVAIALQKISRDIEKRSAK
jgi:ribonuclease P protein component